MRIHSAAKLKIHSCWPRLGHSRIALVIWRSVLRSPHPTHACPNQRRQSPKHGNLRLLATLTSDGSIPTPLMVHRRQRILQRTIPIKTVRQTKRRQAMRICPRPPGVGRRSRIPGVGRRIVPSQQQPVFVTRAGAGFTRVTKSLDRLPNSAGQIWREYDISPYTSQIKSTEDPQKAVTEWILRETGTEMWFNQPLGILTPTETDCTSTTRPKFTPSSKGLSIGSSGLAVKSRI